MKGGQGWFHRAVGRGLRLPRHLHMAFPRRLSLCPNVPCKQGHGHAESQPSSRPHLHLVTSVRPRLQIRSHSELSEVRTSLHEFGTGVWFNPSAGHMFKWKQEKKKKQKEREQVRTVSHEVTRGPDRVPPGRTLGGALCSHPSQQRGFPGHRPKVQAPSRALQGPWPSRPWTGSPPGAMMLPVLSDGPSVTLAFKFTFSPSPWHPS